MYVIEVQSDWGGATSEVREVLDSRTLFREARSHTFDHFMESIAVPIPEQVFREAESMLKHWAEHKRVLLHPIPQTVGIALLIRHFPV